MSAPTQSLTPAQQYFQQGRQYHLGQDGRKVDLEKALRFYLQALRFNPANPDATRELRRLDGGGSPAKKKGFFGKLFGGKDK